VQPLCSSSIDVPPVCAATFCAVAPPSIAPIQVPVIPPPGASDCVSRQVLNPATKRYEWRTICD
jgi:hypothetical protein